jgi:hypothetical protein
LLAQPPALLHSVSRFVFDSFVMMVLPDKKDAGSRMHDAGEWHP